MMRFGEMLNRETIKPRNLSETLARLGKTQTHLPWDSWQRPYVDRDPAVWFHEVFRTDGTPYDPAETELIRTVTGATRVDVRFGPVR